MMPILPVLPIVAVVCGLGRRVAGGVLNQWFSPPGGRVFGDYPARAIWAASIAGAAYLAGVRAWWHVLPVAAGVFIGCAVGHRFNLGPLGLFGGIDLGRKGDVPYWRAVLGMTVHGVCQFGLVAVAAGFGGYPWLPWLVAGLLCVPAYELGWRISPKPTGNASLPVGFRGGSELAEFIWGAVAAVAIVVLTRVLS